MSPTVPMVTTTKCVRFDAVSDVTNASLVEAVGAAVCVINLPLRIDLVAAVQLEEALLRFEWVKAHKISRSP